MAQGMWTKRLTSEGDTFYYNSTLNTSAWQPPVNGIIHEASNLQKPIKQDAPDISQQYHRTSAEVVASSTERLQPSDSVPIGDSSTDQIPAVASDDEAQRMNRLLAEQLLSSVLPLVSQQPAPRQHRSKRFKTAEKDSAESAGQDSAQEAYRKMVSSYQAMAGDGGEEGGKWLVR